jgi:hypothetical protein
MGRRLPNSICKLLITIENWRFIRGSCPYSCPLPHVVRIAVSKSRLCFGGLLKKSLGWFSTSGRRRRIPRYKSNSRQDPLRCAKESLTFECSIPVDTDPNPDDLIVVVQGPPLARSGTFTALTPAKIHCQSFVSLLNCVVAGQRLQMHRDPEIETCICIKDAFA